MARRIPSWPGVLHSHKGRIHLRRPPCQFSFRLQQSGGPYIPDCPEMKCYRRLQFVVRGYGSKRGRRLEFARGNALFESTSAVVNVPSQLRLQPPRSVVQSATSKHSFATARSCLMVHSRPGKLSVKELSFDRPSFQARAVCRLLFSAASLISRSISAYFRVRCGTMPSIRSMSIS